MKKLVCEMCGSSDFIKEEGVFVCQACGCKYSVEEAKKMMIEGTVNIDNSKKVDNLRQLAQRALSVFDYEEANKYYTMLLEESPNSWDASFYAVYCKIRTQEINPDSFELDIARFIKALNTVVENIKNGEITQEEQISALQEISDCIIGYADFCGKFADIILEKAGARMPEKASETYATLINGSLDLISSYGNIVEKMFIDIPEAQKIAVKVWKYAAEKLYEVIGDPCESSINKLVTHIKVYEMDYTLPEISEDKDMDVESEETDEDFAEDNSKKQHSENSSNKLYVTVVKVGHETYKASAFGVSKVFDYGPDPVGGIGVELLIKNIAGKTIKYITVRYTPYNAVGDVVNCTVKGHSTYGTRFTGPLAVGEETTGYSNCIWYNPTITSAKIEYADVTYDDDSTERFLASDLSNEPVEKSGGCYVATCVYGSYDCPEVWTLRRFRDETLGSTWYGRTFIRTYYAISPTLVRWFGHTNWFKKLWRGKLDHMVAKLQANGVEDTPYEDKEW